jgi:hypothetical protein
MAAKAVTFIPVAKLIITTPAREFHACNKVTVQIHAMATSLFANTGVVSSGFRRPKSTRLRYCEKTSEMVATPQGLTATPRVQRNRKPLRGEKILLR